jgi:hypothetical protein
VEEMVVRWWGLWLVKVLVMRWLLVRDLIQQSFLSLPLMMENVEGVLQLGEPRLLSVDVLPMGLGALDCSLCSQDGFLFLSKHLKFLLDSGQLLLLYCCFVFLGFFIPVMDLDLIELCVSLSHAYW